MTDANRRLAMLWGDGDLIRNPVGSTYPADKQIQTTVADQMADENSLYNYYCDLIAFRHKFPAIARGVYTDIKSSEKNLGGFYIAYENETIGLLHNNGTEPLSIDLSKLNVTFTQVLGAIGSGNAVIEENVLIVDPQTSVVVG